MDRFYVDQVNRHVLAEPVKISENDRSNTVQKPRFYLVLVACTSSSTEGATIRSSTACGFAENFRNSILRCRASALTKRFSCRSSKACKPILDRKSTRLNSSHMSI